MLARLSAGCGRRHWDEPAQRPARRVRRRRRALLVGQRERVWPCLEWMSLGADVESVTTEQQGAAQPTMKVMRLRYAGACRDCGAQLAAGTTAVYDKTTKTVQCLPCRDGSSAAREPGPPSDAPPDPDPLDAGRAGASARREYERRSAKRETRIREAHPHLGGLILALSDDPQSTTAWAQGARGEELLGARLDGLADRGVRALHDRRIPRSRANIDHITVGPGGVHVIDAKRYAGKRPERRVDGWLFGNRTEKLFVGGRDKTPLVAGVHKQVAVVREVLDAAGLDEVRVRGVLCFVEAEWPLIGGEFTVDGVDVLWPKRLGERLVPKEPVLTGEQTDAVLRVLARELKHA
ncbi:nuclease-related domain-containing protein [Isoptericola sp. b490]|uniref:nuclease-related domain-containing protein n=1 Tax=Actinotalea lenta TaxID=3064654 RepID=UPI002712897D|nr:nuclease-related domain-containing protein [Isoptericola sp. b490]MDO8121224.1 nuclease-related domain-containing protein [Isoptericola sp. b490]